MRYISRGGQGRGKKEEEEERKWKRRERGEKGEEKKVGRTIMNRGNTPSVRAACGDFFRGVQDQ